MSLQKTDEMKDHISITLVQPDILWEEVALNLGLLDARWLRVV